MNKKIKASVLITALCGSGFVHAHDGEQAELIKNNIFASASVTYRDTVAESNGTLAGAMMGGEAYPLRKGARLDDAQLTAYWNSGNYLLYANVEAHEHGGESEIGVESLYFEFDFYGVDLKAGKFNSEVTERASWHASRATFSQADLMSDVFFGRHFSDTGLSLSKRIKNLRLGFEATSGDAWPGGSREGNVAAFSHINFNAGIFKFQAGAWAMASEALNRFDTRFEQGHNHGGPNQVSPLSSEYSFSGDVNTFGAFLKTQAEFKGFEFGLGLEEIHQKSDGDIFRAGQMSKIESTYEGVGLDSYVSYGSHSIHISYEQIGLENTFFNAPSSVFVSDSGLLNDGFEPEVSKLAYHFAFKEDFVLRIEAIEDKAFDQDGDTYFNLGLKWGRRFFVD